jgi:hypothetical protein
MNEWMRIRKYMHHIHKSIKLIMVFLLYVFMLYDPGSSDVVSKRSKQQNVLFASAAIIRQFLEVLLKEMKARHS